jgi:hypothetical protein
MSSRTAEDAKGSWSGKTLKLSKETLKDLLAQHGAADKAKAGASKTCEDQCK